MLTLGSVRGAVRKDGPYREPSYLPSAGGARKTEADGDRRRVPYTFSVPEVLGRFKKSLRMLTLRPLCHLLSDTLFY